MMESQEPKSSVNQVLLDCILSDLRCSKIRRYELPGSKRTRSAYLYQTGNSFKKDLERVPRASSNEVHSQCSVSPRVVSDSAFVRAVIVPHKATVILEPVAPQKLDGVTADIP